MYLYYAVPIMHPGSSSAWRELSVFLKKEIERKRSRGGKGKRDFFLLELVR